MSDTTRRPGPDSTLDDVREQLIDAATEGLLGRGVEIGVEHIKLSDAIDATGIARATAYRSLSDDDDLEPQERLRREVLTRVLVRRARETSHSVVMEVVGEEFAVQADRFASDELADRSYALRALIRVGTETIYRSVAASRERSILIAAYGAFRSQESDLPNWQETQFREGEAEIARVFGDLYSQLADTFQFTLRPGVSMAQFATAVVSLLEGLAIREGLSDELGDIVRNSGPSGEAENWTLFGIAFDGMFRAFFEPKSSENPFADPELV